MTISNKNKEIGEIKRSVLFDLDGTLLSTLDTIFYYLNRTLRKNGYSQITLDECREYIGNGARLLVERALAKVSVDDPMVVGRVLVEYSESYNDDPIPYTEPYEGITSLIEELRRRGFALGVVTNKPDPTAKKLIEHFFPGMFSVVLGGREGAVLKPDPADALRALSLIGSKSGRCAFIGDTSVDVLTARNMGAALAVAVSWGFRTREELLLSSPDAIVDSPREILYVVEKL